MLSVLKHPQVFPVRGGVEQPLLRTLTQSLGDLGVLQYAPDDLSYINLVLR